MNPAWPDLCQSMSPPSQARIALELVPRLRESLPMFPILLDPLIIPGSDPGSPQTDPELPAMGPEKREQATGTAPSVGRAVEDAHPSVKRPQSSSDNSLNLAHEETEPWRGKGSEEPHPKLPTTQLSRAGSILPNFSAPQSYKTIASSGQEGM